MLPPLQNLLTLYYCGTSSPVLLAVDTFYTLAKFVQALRLRNFLAPFQQIGHLNRV